MSEEETLTNRDETSFNRRVKPENIPTTTTNQPGFKPENTNTQPGFKPENTNSQPGFKPENPSSSGCGGCSSKREPPIVPKTEYVDKRRSNGHCPADKSVVNTSAVKPAAAGFAADKPTAAAATDDAATDAAATDTAATDTAATGTAATGTAGDYDELGDSEFAEILEIADEFIEQSAEKSTATDSSDESPLFDGKSDSDESDHEFDKTVKSNKSALVKSEAKIIKPETKIIKSEPTAAEDGNKSSGNKSAKKVSRNGEQQLSENKPQQGQKKKPFK